MQILKCKGGKKQLLQKSIAVFFIYLVKRTFKSNSHVSDENRSTKSNTFRGVKRAMDKQTFDALAAQTKLKQRALKMAEDFLCHGMSAAEIAKREGMSRQLVNQAANRILKQMQLTDQHPEDWVTVTTTLPKAWAQWVLYIQAVEHAKAGLLVKSAPKVPAFELTDIAELSKRVEEVLAQWRKL